MATMGWRLDPADCAVLVVDVQERLMAAVPDRDRIVARTALLARAARVLGLRVLLTEHIPSKLGSIVADVAAAAGDAARFEKAAFSAGAVLPPDVPRSLLVCGVETHVCVRQTVYDLRQKQKSVTVLADACGSRRDLDHNLTMRELSADRVIVTSVEAALFELMGTAEHPKFREVLALVK